MSHTPASSPTTSSLTPAPLPAGFSEATAEVNGVTIHYVAGGTGEPLVLVHGWPQTWYCWNRIMPQLAEHYTNIAHNPPAITEAEINEYVRAYSAPGAMSAGFEWFRAFPTDIDQNLAGARSKLPMPVLALGGEKMMGRFMVPMLQAVAEDVRGGSIPDCGHWLAEEKPDYLLAQLNDFLP